MSIDPISNLISIIKNGYQVHKPRVYVPFSKEKENILKVLKEQNYLKNVKIIEKEKKKVLAVRLFYPNGDPAINQIKRISKPGQRLYAKPSKFKPVLAFSKTGLDLGATIVSTSKGIMTAKEAKKKNIGGELILKVY